MASYSANSRRLSQSMNRVALLGHMAGIEPSELPAVPTRTESPLSQIEDQLRTVHGAPSNDSLTAVVSQQPQPGSGSGGLRGREPQRSSVVAAGGDSGRGSGSRSRSRASKRSLMEQQRQTQPRSDVLRRELDRRRAEAAAALPAPEVITSQPSVLCPGPKAASEAGYDTGVSTSKKLSSIRFTPQRKSYIPPVPTWIAKAIGSETTPANSEQELLLAASQHDAAYYRDPDCDGQRASVATIAPENYVDHEEPRTPGTPASRGRSAAVSAARSVSGMSDDGRSCYSAYSTATYSHYPRGFGMAGFEQYQSRRLSQAPVSGVDSSRARELAQQQAAAAAEKKKKKNKYVREEGVDFEMMPSSPVATPAAAVAATSATSPTAPRPRPHPRPTSLYIPPSQEPASSFTLLSATSTYNPSPSPSPTTTSTPSPGAASSSWRSSRSGTGTAQPSPSSPSSATSRSRSPSPARGAYNPRPDPRPSMSDRVSERLERALDSRLRKAAIRPPRQRIEFGEVRRAEQEDISGWQFPARREPAPSPVGPLPPSPLLLPVSPAPVPGPGPSFKERAGGGPGGGGGDVGGTRGRLQRSPGRGRGGVVAYVPGVAVATSGPPTHAQASAVPLLEQERDELFCRVGTRKRQSLFAPGSEHGSELGSEVRLNSQCSSLRSAGLEFGFDTSPPPAPIARAETPPSFDNDLERTDSLFVKTAPGKALDFFVPPWAHQQQSRSLTPTAQSMRSIPSDEQLQVAPLHGSSDGGATVATDPRRGLPSQQISQTSTKAIHRKPLAAGAVVLGGTVNVASKPTTPPSGNGRSLRRRADIDFSKIREGN